MISIHQLRIGVNMGDDDEAIVTSWEPYVVKMRKLKDGRWIGIQVRMYNTIIMIDMTTYGYRDAF